MPEIVGGACPVAGGRFRHEPLALPHTCPHLLPSLCRPLYRVHGPSRWSPTNPNILTVSLPNGVIREVKVTKRGFEEPQPGAFGTSEYCRVADAYPDAGLNSVPKVGRCMCMSEVGVGA